MKVSDLPAPRSLSLQRFVWEPPVPLQHAASDTEEDVALAALRAPAIVHALGLNDEHDEFFKHKSKPSPGRFSQAYHFEGKALKVHDGFVTVSLDDGFKLKSIDASAFQRGLEMPKRVAVSRSAAQRIMQRHTHFRGDPELAFFGGRLVYATETQCHSHFVDASHGSYTKGPFTCRILEGSPRPSTP